MTVEEQVPNSVEQRRAAVEQLVRDVPGGRPGEMSFQQPWEIRAFALAVAAHEQGRFDWAAFQGRLIESIKGWEDSVEDLHDRSWSYYHHWVTALEGVLADQGTLDPAALDDKAHQVLITPPDRHNQKAHLEPVAVDPASRPQAR